MVGSFAAPIAFDGTVLKSKGMKDVFVVAFDAKGNSIGSFSFGGTGGESVKVVGRPGVAPLVVAGTTSDAMTIGTVSFDAGAYLLRFTDALKPVSALAIPGCTFLASAALDEVTENAYLVLNCQKQTDLGGGPLAAGRVLLAVDKNNQHLFSRSLPSSAQVEHLLALDGALYLAGTFKDSVDFGNGALTTKYSSEIKLFVVRMTK